MFFFILKLLFEIVNVSVVIVFPYIKLNFQIHEVPFIVRLHLAKVNNWAFAIFTSFGFKGFG